MLAWRQLPAEGSGAWGCPPHCPAHSPSASTCTVCHHQPMSAQQSLVHLLTLHRSCNSFWDRYSPGAWMRLLAISVTGTRRDLQMCSNPINIHRFFPRSILLPQRSQSFSHSVWRVTYNPIQKPCHPQWRVCYIGNDIIQQKRR